MADYAKRQLKALDRIAKKIADAEGHLTKIEDSVDNEKHRTAQHETIKDIKSILKHAWKVDVNTDLKLSEITGLKMYFFTGLNAVLYVVPCNLSCDMIYQKF